MNPTKFIRTISASPEATLALAERIGGGLVSGDVLGLSGDLGAGKTTFVRGLAAGMGITDPVSSPTYTLMHAYEGSGLKLFHYDAWMEGRQKALLAEGGAGVLEAGGVAVVEWAGRVQEFLPESALWVEFVHRSLEERELRFLGPEGVWERLLRVFEPIEGLNWAAGEPDGAAAPEKD